MASRNGINIKEGCILYMIVNYFCVYLSLRGFRRQLERVQVDLTICFSMEKSWSKEASRVMPRSSRTSCRNSCSTVPVSFRAWAICTHACSAWDWYISMHGHKLVKFRCEDSLKPQTLFIVSSELESNSITRLYWNKIKVRIIISTDLPHRILANQAADWIYI